MFLTDFAMSARASKGPSKGSEIQALKAQIPPDGTPFSLDDLHLTEIDYRGKALYAKVAIDEGEGAEALLQRFKAGEEERGRCGLLRKALNRGKEAEWRLTCCYGKHDKLARKDACDAIPGFLESSDPSPADPAGNAQARSVPV